MKEYMTLRVYMKGGHVLTLPRVTEFEFHHTRIGRTMKLTQREGDGGELLAMPSLDLSEVVAITYEKHAAPPGDA